MLNYIKADLYKIFSKPSMWIWCVLFISIPMIIILGIGKQYDLETILAVTPMGIYIEFFVISLIVSENTFREEMQLNLYKNDTTNGISRTKLFVSKFLTGTLIEIILWTLCSVLVIAACIKIFDIQIIKQCFSSIFSIQTLSLLLINLIYLILLQIIGIYVKKTSATILICIILSAVFSNIKNVIVNAIPSLNNILDSIKIVNTQTIFTEIAFPVIGIIALLIIGCNMFKRSEL